MTPEQAVESLKRWTRHQMLPDNSVGRLVISVLEQAQRERGEWRRVAEENARIADERLKEREEAQAKLAAFSELARACRIRLQAEGWSDSEACSDLDAIKRYILNSEYHVQTGK